MNIYVYIYIYIHLLILKNPCLCNRALNQRSSEVLIRTCFMLFVSFQMTLR